MVGNIDSAPHEVELYGIDASNQKQKLADFVYDTDGPPVQTFKIRNGQVFHYLPCFNLLFTGLEWRKVQFQFLSNWGAEHTCIYRLRVHGVHLLN